MFKCVRVGEEEEFTHLNHFESFTFERLQYSTTHSTVFF